jgi:hypothetical protein
MKVLLVGKRMEAGDRRRGGKFRLKARRRVKVRVRVRRVRVMVMVMATHRMK